MTAAGASPHAVSGATPSDTGAPAVTLVAGSSFLRCTPDGEIVPGGTHGYFAGDMRVLASMAVLVDGVRPRLLESEAGEDRLVSSGTVGDPADPDVLVERRLELSDALRLVVALENLRGSPTEALVEVALGADFADIFDVKAGIPARGGFVGAGPVRDGLLFAYRSGDFRRGLRVRADLPADVLRDGLRVALALEAHGRRELRIDLVPEGEPGVALRTDAPTPERTLRAPVLRSDLAPLEAAWDRSCADLAALLMVDPARPDRTVVAAGSPWFMALFGRDSLITSLAAMPLGTELAVGVLQALADRQGRGDNPVTAEQPGRILHEVRSGEAVRRHGGWGDVYYGSVDATPLFVMVLAEAWRWGAPPADVEALLPAAEAAGRWITGPADPDGDGFVEYPGRADGGLVNQAWKDSDGAVRHPDGTIAAGPIAMVEVQGYCHAALLALADLLDAFGRPGADAHRARADALAAAIDEAFWMDDEDCYAMALDGAKRPVRSVTTNAGHLLWTGTATGDRARRLAARLVAPDVYTGFGLRTLSSANPAYNPLSYHCGSVWPHDTALVATGMLQRGCTREGLLVADALLDASVATGSRLPELFGGFDRRQHRRPVPYPTSCSPQAWSAGAPLMLTAAALGLAVDVPRGEVGVAPRLPDGAVIELGGVPIADGRLDLAVRGSTVERVTAPPAVEVRSA